MSGFIGNVRPIGGIDNNLINPSLDALPGSSELRITGPNFGPDGAVAPGGNARTISNIVSSGPQAEATDPTRSAWLYTFGQFVDHDLDLENQVASQPLSIPVPNGDPNLPNGSVIPTGGRAQLDASGHIVNTIAGYLDLSQVYGSDAATAASLRNADGTLKTSDGKDLPIVNGQFVAGDVRVNENPELVAVTTLFVREHNFQVAQLKAAHPDWTGDQLYNAARTITTGEYQNVIYTEYLPALLGAGAVPNYHGYDPSVSSQVTEEFSDAAFRVGHSQVSGTQSGVDNNGVHTFTQSLASAFLNSPQQDIINGVDDLLRHMSSDVSQATDIYAVEELRSLLVAPPDAIDLIAIDIERTRDVGLGTLNDARADLGLPRYTSFGQISSDPAVVARLTAAYPTVNDIDLFIGGLAEDQVHGGTVGQTFNAIISKQFDALQTGDRFFWQNQGLDATTAIQIGSTTLSDIISRNTATPHLQSNVFLAADRHLSTVAAVDDGAQLVIGTADNNAVVAGGPGDDTIFAGTGLHQTLVGEGGADVFVFNTANDDTIADFDPAHDKLDLRGILDTADSVLATGESGGTVLHMAAGTIHLTGVGPGALSATDFVQPIKLLVSS